MTSQSRNQRGGGGGGQGGALGGSSGQAGQHEIVAAAVASMANTQPLALVKHDLESKSQERLRADSHDSDSVPNNN